MTIVGGPSLLGIAAMTTFSGNVLHDPARVQRKGWLALGAEVSVVIWMLFFVGLSAPTMLRSWTADGSIEPTLVLLTATAVVALAVLGISASRVMPTLRYVDESYRTDDNGWAITLVRRFTRHVSR
jgi:protein-S-isoprenylcysteine O-methyltransferase Ste14